MSAEEYEFKCLTWDQLRPHLPDDHPLVDEYEHVRDWGESSWQSVIALFGPDGFEKVIAADGGEPEDNSFQRDGSWIAPALTAALRGELHRLPEW